MLQKAMLLATRTLSIKMEGGSRAEVPIKISAPEQLGGSWRCSYTIGWPGTPWESAGWGVDAIQAIVLTLQKIGIELYASSYHEARSLEWLEPLKGYGFPLGPGQKDLLIGYDLEDFA